MGMTTWLHRAFPLEGRTAVGGLAFGFLLAAVLWLPLPASVQLPGWLLPGLLVVLAAVLLALYFTGRPLFAPPGALGWRGLGLAAAGGIFSLIPLGDAVRTAVPPAALLIAGLLLTVVQLVRTVMTSGDKHCRDD